jgi:hypothetical protein
MAWADKARVCVDWREEDQARLAELRRWLESEQEEMIEDLADRLIKSNGAQPLMRNARFVQRLHDVLREWLMGLMKGPFDDGRAERRLALGQRLANVDLTFEDVILLEAMTHQRLFALAERRVGEQPQELSSTMRTLNKVMTYDRGLVYAGCLDLHDAELEDSLLDRFLTVTGFSPTLYESLVEAWRWSHERIGHRRG